MPNADDDGFEEAFKGFGEDPAPATPPGTDPVTPPATPPPAAAEPPKDDDKTDPAKPEPPKPTEEPKKDEEPAKPGEEPKKPEDPTSPATDEEKKEDPAKPAAPPETPSAPETPQPLTKSDVESVVSNLLTTERASGKALESTTQEVLEKFYPEGLSDVLVDEKSGRELKTPQDVISVVEASGGQMSTEQAAQWLMNEQFKLNQQIDNIKTQAKQIAETNINFRRDAVTALQKYAPLFEKYPTLQEKVYNKLMKQVKVDKERDVILSAPDVMEHYDDFLEPYQQAFEYATNKPATNPTPAPGGDPAKPGTEDRMDEGGDGGTAPVDDPNDFAQQVVKELNKGA